jgi:hypothetical protein
VLLDLILLTIQKHANWCYKFLIVSDAVYGWRTINVETF